MKMQKAILFATPEFQKLIVLITFSNHCLSHMFANFMNVHNTNQGYYSWFSILSENIIEPQRFQT